MVLNTNISDLQRNVVIGGDVLGFDSWRTSNSLNFEVLHKAKVLVSGFFEHSEPMANAEDYYEAVSTPKKNTKLVWTMECGCEVGQFGCMSMKERHDKRTQSGVKTSWCKKGEETNNVDSVKCTLNINIG
jgi:hypothetical protein